MCLSFIKTLRYNQVKAVWNLFSCEDNGITCRFGEEFVHAQLSNQFSKVQPQMIALKGALPRAMYVTPNALAAAETNC